MFQFFERHEFSEIRVTGVVDNIEGRIVLRRSCFGRENAEAEVNSMLHYAEQVEYEETGKTVSLYAIGDTVFDDADICDINAKHAEKLLVDASEGGKPGADQKQRRARQFVEHLLSAAEAFEGDEWTASGGETLLNAMLGETAAIAELRVKLSLGTDEVAS